MSTENPERLFTVVAKDPVKQELADVLQAIVDHIGDTDEFRDKVGLPRKGREPDYLYGRWCVKCHNSLPEDWGIKDCDVCGAKTGNRSGESPWYASVVQQKHEYSGL